MEDGVLDLPEGNAPGWVLKTPEKCKNEFEEY